MEELFGPTPRPSRRVTFQGSEEPQPSSQRRPSVLSKQERVTSQSEGMSNKSALDDLLFGPVKRSGEDGPSGGTAGSSAAKPSAPSKPQGASSAKLDDLFGPSPASRRGEPRAKSTADWLGAGRDDDEDADDAFSSALAAKRRDAPPRDTSPPKPVVKAPPKSSALSFLDPTAKAPPPATQPPPQQQAPAYAAPSYAAPAYQPVPQVAAAEPVSSAAWREERAALVADWKARLAEREAELKEELRELREKQKGELERERAEWAEAVERLKTRQSMEAEAGASAADLRRSYADTAALVTEAAEKLARLSQAAEGREAGGEEAMRERERRLTALQDRLDRDQEDLRLEREKVQTLLAKLELRLRESETEKETTGRDLDGARQKLEVDRSVFEEEKARLLESVRREREDLMERKGRFLEEQRELMGRLLGEQERVEAEALAFSVQRDADVAKLRAEAVELDERLRQALALERRGEESLREADQRRKRLMQLEQALSDEREQLDKDRARLARQSRSQSTDTRASHIRRVSPPRDHAAVKESALDLLRRQAELGLELSGNLEGGRQEAERPFEEPTAFPRRQGSIRSRLRSQAEATRHFLTSEAPYLSSLQQSL